MTVHDVEKITRSENGEYLILWFKKPEDKDGKKPAPLALYVHTENVVYVQQDGTVLIER